MKNEYQIYLAGGMQGLSFDEMNEWRSRFKEKLIRYANAISPNSKLIVVNPCDYYNFEKKEYRTQREVMEYDLHRVRTSQLIVVDFTHKPVSIGTAMELAVAREHNIPIIGVCTADWENSNDNPINHLHPWQKECCMRLCESYEELENYIKKFFLFE